MNKRKIVFLTGFVVIIVMIWMVISLLFSYDENEEGKNTEKVQAAAGKGFSLTDEKRGEPGYIALLEDNSLIYFYYDKEKAEYYRYDSAAGESFKIGTINGFCSDTGSYVRIGDAIFFYAARWKETIDSADLKENKSEEQIEVKNYLYKIDLKENCLEQVTKDTEADSSLPGLYISKLEQCCVTLKNEIREQNIVTYLEFYDSESGQYEKTEEAVFDPQKQEGEAYYVCYGDGQRVYAIKDVYKEKECESFLLEYDPQKKLTKQSLIQEEELKKFLQRGRIYKMEGGENSFSLFSTAGEGYLGLIEEEEGERKIATLFQMEGFCSVMDARNFDKTDDLYYVQRENYLLTLDLTDLTAAGIQKGLHQIPLQVEEESGLRLLFALRNGENLFLVMEDEEFHTRCYILKKSEIENYVFY